jgi:hypothetical protein
LSEYQYYEFLAVDRPLTEREMAELGCISSRAQITPASFSNEYTFGALRLRHARKSGFLRRLGSAGLESGPP